MTKFGGFHIIMMVSLWITKKCYAWVEGIFYIFSGLRIMMFNATFNNILIILWSRSFYLKGHVTYCHHFVSLIVVANKRLKRPQGSKSVFVCVACIFQQSLIIFILPTLTAQMSFLMEKCEAFIWLYVVKFSHFKLFSAEPLHAQSPNLSQIFLKVTWILKWWNIQDGYPCVLIGLNSFDSRTTVCEVTRLGRNVPLMVLGPGWLNELGSWIT